MTLRLLIGTRRKWVNNCPFILFCDVHLIYSVNLMLLILLLIAFAFDDWRFSWSIISCWSLCLMLMLYFSYWMIIDLLLTLSRVRNRKVKKGRPMKRSKNVRKAKSIAKAISKNEQSVEKVLKHDSKKLRTHSAKLLYEWRTKFLLQGIVFQKVSEISIVFGPCRNLLFVLTSPSITFTILFGHSALCFLLISLVSSLVYLR